MKKSLVMSFLIVSLLQVPVFVIGSCKYDTVKGVGCITIEHVPAPIQSTITINCSDSSGSAGPPNKTWQEPDGTYACKWTNFICESSEIHIANISDYTCEPITFSDGRKNPQSGVRTWNDLSCTIVAGK